MPRTAVIRAAMATGTAEAMAEMAAAAVAVTMVATMATMITRLLVATTATTTKTKTAQVVMIQQQLEQHSKRTVAVATGRVPWDMLVLRWRTVSLVVDVVVLVLRVLLI